MVKIKSIHARPHSEDGKRYLVDLFWPEGLPTRAAKIDEWVKELAPSYDLQRFAFDKLNWPDYQFGYRSELTRDKTKLARLRAMAREAHEHNVTLLYGHNDPHHNHATILKELIEQTV